MKTKINSKKPTTNNQQPNTKKGITLVALVVTIVVLIILAGVTLSLVLDHEGIISKSRKAVADYKNAQTNEKEQITAMEEYINQSAGQSVKLISFTIDGTTYHADDHYSRWEMWCSSSFNINSLVTMGKYDEYMYVNGKPLYDTSSNSWSLVTEKSEIIDGGAYCTREGDASEPDVD